MKNTVLDGIIGLCVADALGVPVEFIKREQLIAKPVTEMKGFGTHNQPVGTWSDDTSLTLCLLDSLSNGLDYNDIMAKFHLWLEEGAYTPYGEVFDVGIGTRQAIKRYASGIDPLMCGGVNEFDNGNGSLMRILPLVFYIQSLYGNDFQKFDEVFDLIHDVSALTHAHKCSQIACGIYISVASKIIGNMDIRVAVELGIYEANEYYKQKPEFMPDLTRFSRLLVNNFYGLNVSEIKSSGYVVDTLEAAIWCLLNSKSYKECVLLAVNLGEDTDTVAAVAGGLAGLYYGYKNIPSDWINQIVKREYIEELSNKLYISLMRESIGRLIAFIPYFENVLKEQACQWSGGEKIDENSFTMPYPVYDKVLEDFIQTFYKSNLMCYNYLDVIKLHKIDGTKEMNDALDNSDIELTLAILTGYVRQERFCDGLWQSAVEDKTFLKLLRRLDALIR